MDHSAHSAPTTEEENQQEESQYDKSYEGKLAADLYRDHSSQNKVAIEVFIVAASMGIGYPKEVIDSYNILKKPLDPKKLVTDPEYRKQVQRALQLVQRYEGKNLRNGRSKYIDDVNRTKAALGQVRTTHEKVETTRKRIAEKQLSIDVKRIYGLGDKEVASVCGRVLQRMKDYPGQFSLREAMRIEARNVSMLKVEQEVKEDKKVSRWRRKEETNRRIEGLNLDAKDASFITNSNTTAIHEFAKQQDEKLVAEGIQSVSFTLGTESKPQPTPQPQPAAAPAPPKFTLPGLDIKSKIANFLAKSAALQAFRVAMKNAIAYSLKALRSVGLRSVAKLGLSFARSTLPFLFKTGSRLAIKAGLTAAGAAASLGTTLLAQAGLEIFKKITGIDIEKFALRAAAGAVLAIVAVFILIIIGTSSLFSTRTAYDPMIIPQTADSRTQIYSWQEFEKMYLTNKTNQTNNSNLVWEGFEKTYLIY